MIRKTLKMFALACVAVFALGTMAEAAPKKVLHRRAKHSTRVSSPGAAATMKKATHKKRASRKTAAASRTAHRRPTTKPR